MRGVILCLLLLVPAAAIQSGAAEARAAAWLHAHGPDDAGDLSDFAKTDPDGYALVKALMLKRSLGLLDPRKPTASFAAPATHESDDDQPAGAAAFAKFAAPGELKKHATAASEPAYPEAVAAPYPEAQASSARGFAWKPPSNDDDMVASVLGSVSQLTGGAPQRSLLSQNRDVGAVSHLTADEMLMGVAGSDATAIPTFVAPTAAFADQQPSAPVPHVASHQSQAPSGPFGMPALSWGISSAPAIDASSTKTIQSAVVQAVAPVAAASVARAPVVHASPAVDNPYLSGIDFGDKAKHQASAPVQVVAPQAAASADNPYLEGIDFGVKVKPVPSASAFQAPVSSQQSANPTVAAADAVSSLNFNDEIAKISSPGQPFAQVVSKASPAKNIQKKKSDGSSYLDSIGFAGMGLGAAKALDDVAPKVSEVAVAHTVQTFTEQPIKPTVAQAEAPVALDFNAEVEKISTPFQQFAKLEVPTSKPKASLASQTQTVQKKKSGSNSYVDSIGLAGMLNGNIGGDDDLRLFRFGDEKTPTEPQPLTMAMQTEKEFDVPVPKPSEPQPLTMAMQTSEEVDASPVPSLRRQSMPTTLSTDDFEKPSAEVTVGKWLGRDQESEETAVQLQTPADTNMYMADLA